MMLKIITSVAFVIFLLESPTVSATQKLDDSLLKNMGELIRLEGFVCDWVNGGLFIERGHKGKIFRILCQDNALAYRVTITTGKKILIKPWK